MSTSELSLKCNVLKCREQLSDNAVVTTCSHIFCASCADELGLSHSSETTRHCPACRTDLPYPDDVVTTNLKPTEDYKTSVLSGLDPAIIMECASRGLAFWTYQATQEVFYQEFLGKNLTDRYGKLSNHLDKTINDANSEIDSLGKQISGLQLEKADLHKKNEELYRMYTEKTKKHQQTQHLYDTLKKRILMSQVQTAASDTVNRTVNSLTSATRPNTFTGNAVPSGRRSMPEIGDRLQQDPLFDANGVELLHSHQRSGSASNHSADAAIMPPPERPNFHRQQPFIAPTPQHRTQLPTSRNTGLRPQIPLNTFHVNHQPSVSRPPGFAARQPLINGSSLRNSQSSSGYGISAGVKMGRAPTSAPLHHLNHETRSSDHARPEDGGTLLTAKPSIFLGIKPLVQPRALRFNEDIDDDVRKW